MRDYLNGAGRTSYAVVWREPAGSVCSGELELGPETLRLEGTCRTGRYCLHEIAYSDVTSVRVGRALRERIDGRSTLILEARGALLYVTTTVGLGMIHEMAERLQALMSRPLAL